MSRPRRRPTPRWPPQRVKELGDPTQAAIASEEAGSRFGLVVLKRDIANQP